MAKDVTHVIRLVLDRALRPLGGSVTSYEDEAVTYTVDLLAGPFDTPEEALLEGLKRLDRQGLLW